MLIKIKNTDKFQYWLEYYQLNYPNMAPYEQRTMAFINSIN